MNLTSRGYSRFGCQLENYRYADTKNQEVRKKQFTVVSLQGKTSEGKRRMSQVSYTAEAQSTQRETSKNKEVRSQTPKCLECLN